MTGRALPPVKRLVIKVGTSSLVDPGGGASARKMAKIVDDIAAVAAGRACVLVSSGAIAAGLGPLGLTRRPSDMPSLQAAAAVGQGVLMSEYARLFARRSMVAGQVLLTQDDFVRRRQFVNARNTLVRLLSAGAVPVVNENDTVGTEEIRFGDNDRLAALVSVMVAADLLILLSDVDGIYTRDPSRGRGELVTEMAAPEDVEATGPRSGLGAGGMASKLHAAGIATAGGIGVVVAGAEAPEVLARILAGEEIGTWLPPRARRRSARKAWLAFASGTSGRILVDEGAELAVTREGRSLLAAGVVGVEGGFGAGDAIELVGPGGRTFARGIANYSSQELPQLAGRSSRDLATLPGGPYDREVVHRDELVVMEPWERSTG